MKSIRVSLIVYFLLLLAVAWGTASWLVYRSAADSLQAKQVVTRQLLDTQLRELCQQEHDRFDEHLLDKAQIIAHRIHTRFLGERLAIARLVVLGLMNESQAHLNTYLWLQQATTRSSLTPVTPTIARKLTTQIRIDDADLPPRDTEAGLAEYFQVDHEYGNSWPSAELGEQPLFAAGPFDPKKHIESRADDVHLPWGKTVRRVQLKFVPGTRISFSYQGRRRGGPGPPPSEGGSERPPPPMPWIVVHCASETAKRDAAVAAHRSDFAARLDEQSIAGATELSQLRRRLLLIGVATFAAMALGSYLLLGIGLAPLRRLSDAVSRVSPRDFKLPLEDDANLGVELAPVAVHMRETLEQLRRAFEREKQASADISHELRTPVASLMATLDVALRKPRTVAEYRQTLLDCRVVGGQMRQLVERLMALARLDAGSDEVRPCPVDVAELVDECTTLVKPLAGERGVSLSVACPPELTVNTDPVKLREILVNLLHNAVQYNRPNGSIDVSAETSGNWLDLRVRDTGVGIAPEATTRIFERFYRADPSRNADDLHAGLGLSIVKGYVGLLGGTIRVESQSGQGSTFHLRLPAGLAA